MRILIIISQYSPAQTPNTLRWIPIAKYFDSLGHNVSILTTKRAGFPEKDTQGPITVYRAGYNTLKDRIYDMFKKRDRRNEVGAGQTETSIIGSLLERVIDLTWRKYYWPDGSQLFLKLGIKKGKELLESDQYDIIYSVGLPFTCHMIAKALKEENPKLHWHMDIEDPFCYSEEFWVNNFDKYKKKNEKAEKEAFAKADRISVTNGRAMEKYIDLFPSQESKLTVIPPVFVSPDSSVSKDLMLYSEKIHLGYFGSFYNGVRSPLKFFQFLEYLHHTDASLFDEIQFHFIGQLDRATLALFEAFPEVRRYAVIHGFMNRDETISAMLQTDILMNFGNSTDYHLPSKVVDYLYTSKPILNLTSIENDSTQKFLMGHNDMLNLLLEKENFEKLRTQFLKFIFKERPSLGPSLDSVRDYAVDKIGDQYLSPIKHI